MLSSCGRFESQNFRETLKDAERSLNDCKNEMNVKLQNELQMFSASNVDMRKQFLQVRRCKAFFYIRERCRSVYFKYQKQYFISSKIGVLSTTVNSNLGLVDTGTGRDVREEQKQDFDQNQDSVHRYS